MGGSGAPWWGCPEPWALMKKLLGGVWLSPDPPRGVHLPHVLVPTRSPLGASTCSGDGGGGGSPGASPSLPTRRGGSGAGRNLPTAPGSRRRAHLHGAAALASPALHCHRRRCGHRGGHRRHAGDQHVPPVGPAARGRRLLAGLALGPAAGRQEPGGGRGPAPAQRPRPGAGPHPHDAAGAGGPPTRSPRPRRRRQRWENARVPPRCGRRSGWWEPMGWHWVADHGLARGWGGCPPPQPTPAPSTPGTGEGSGVALAWACSILLGSCLSFPTCPLQGIGTGVGVGGSPHPALGWGGGVAFLPWQIPPRPPPAFERCRWPGSKLLHLTSALAASALLLRPAPAWGFAAPPPRAPRAEAPGEFGGGDRSPPAPRGLPRAQARLTLPWLAGPRQQPRGGGEAGGQRGAAGSLLGLLSPGLALGGCWGGRSGCGGGFRLGSRVPAGVTMTLLAVGAR